MKIIIDSQTETRYYSNVPLNEKIINKPQKLVIIEVNEGKPFSQAFKSFLEYVLLFILSIFGFITLGSIHGSIAFLILLLGIFLAFCVFVKSVELFEATADFISNH